MGSAIQISSSTDAPATGHQGGLVLSPVDIVEDFFHKRIQGEEHAEVARVDPTKAHEMRRWDSLDDTQKQRIERLGLQGKLSKAAVVKRPFWLSAVGASALLSISNGGFKADGPDDFANLAKESVEGVAQPLAHLGVLIPLYPFVRMAAKGLGLDLKDLRSNQRQVKQDIKAEVEELAKLQEQANDHLASSGFSIPELKVTPSSRHCFQDFKKQYKSLSKNYAHLLQVSPQSAPVLTQYLDCAMKLGFLLEASVEYGQEKKEAWTAAKGMRGMQRAMELFVGEATSSLLSFLTKGSAASTFQNVATGIGTLGTGFMAVAQFLMMSAGLFKAGSGVRDFKSMRAQSKTDQQHLLVVEHLDQKQMARVLERKNRHTKQLCAWKPMSKIIPGTSLAVGQALMLSWSVASLAFLASGVAAPAGLAMMLGLVIPGVVLTLASALPKIGLESVFEKALDKRFGENGEEDGFDAVEYAQSLPKNRHELAEQANTQGQLLDRLEQDDSNGFLKSIDVTQSDDTAQAFAKVYHLLSKADKLEAFSSALVRAKGGKSLFSQPEKITIEKDLKPVLAWKNVKNPLRLRHTQLFHAHNKRTSTQTFLHFDPKKVEEVGDDLRKQALETAADTLKDFITRQVRSQVRVSERCLEHMI